MTTSYCKVCLLCTLAVLAGCTQSHAIPELKNQVVELQQVIGALTDQTIALERQNRLNQHSTSGVYLLPTANNAANLQSRVGELSVSIDNVKREVSGSQVVLSIRTLSASSLPGFTATLEWGQLNSATGRPLVANVQSQSIRIQSNNSLLPKNEQVFALYLNGVTPDQLGYIRLHNVTPNPQ